MRIASEWYSHRQADTLACDACSLMHYCRSITVSLTVRANNQTEKVFAPMSKELCSNLSCVILDEAVPTYG